MGVIARQGIKRSLISIVGVLIGMISTLFIYPLEHDANGFAQFIFGTATLVSIVLGFGSSGLVVKYFPEFKNIKGYFSIVLSYGFINIVIISILFFIFKKNIFVFLEGYGFQVDKLQDNIKAIFILAILTVVIRFLIYQSANFKRIVIPAFIHEFLYKIYLPVLLLLYHFDYIVFSNIPYAIVGFYFLSFVLNLVYLKSLGGFDISSKTFLSLPKSKIKEMYTYAGFSGLNALSANITTRIDILMITMLVAFTGTSIYSIFLFMSNVIAIPNASLNQIASPVISDSMENGDMANIDAIYKKTSLNSFIVGAILFIIIWSILPDLISIMPSEKNMMPYIYVFLFLGLAKLIDMFTSVNSYIMIYSKYYKYNLGFLLVLAVLNIVLNYFLINIYGITGAALATLISIFLYNVAKLIFIKSNFDLFPFDKKSVKIIIIGIIVFIIGIMLPDFALINLGYKPVVLILVYYTLIKTFRLKADIIDLGEDIVFKITGINLGHRK